MGLELHRKSSLFCIVPVEHIDSSSLYLERVEENT